MRLPRSYLMLAHAAFFAILTIACANDNAVQPAGPLTVSTLEVTVTTSGSDPDTDGYFLGGTRPGDAEGMSIDAVVPVNGTATLSGIPADTYKMVLEGVAPNCDPVTQLPPQLVIENARVARLSIHIQCTDSLQLTYRVGPSSSGGDSLSVTGQVWMVDLTGKNVSRVTTDSRSHETPAWSPDGSRLAFVSDREGGATIWIMEPTGDVSPVNTGLQQNFGPQWSPDGQRLVFFSPVDGITQLFTINADGTDLRAVTSRSAGDYDPSWSPDGKKIVFASNRDDIPGIWVINTDGTAPKRLTGQTDITPVWSPDGATIAFSRLGFRTQSLLYTINADGSSLVFRSTLPSPSRLTWSPNGRKIAFASISCPKDTCYSFVEFVGFDGIGYSPVTVPRISGDVAFRNRR